MSRLCAGWSKSWAIPPGTRPSPTSFFAPSKGIGRKWSWRIRMRAIGAICRNLIARNAPICWPGCATPALIKRSGGFIRGRRPFSPTCGCLPTACAFTGRTSSRIGTWVGWSVRWSCSAFTCSRWTFASTARSMKRRWRKSCAAWASLKTTASYPRNKRWSCWRICWRIPVPSPLPTCVFLRRRSSVWICFGWSPGRRTPLGMRRSEITWSAWPRGPVTSWRWCCSPRRSGCSAGRGIRWRPAFTWFPSWRPSTICTGPGRSWRRISTIRPMCRPCGGASPIRKSCWGIPTAIRTGGCWRPTGNCIGLSVPSAGWPGKTGST